MKRNKIFRLNNSLRTSIHLDGRSVTHYQQLHEFSSEAEAEGFFNQCIQELLTQGWRDTELVETDENNQDFSPDELREMFLEVESRLDEFANAIARPYIEINPYSTLETTLWQSKFGGFPYFPKYASYPTSPDGTPLTLLAQINFAEVPHLADFPEKGILQFYIEATNRTAYGLEDSSQLEQTTFRVIYVPKPDLEIDNLLTSFDFLPEPNGLPLEGCCALKFAIKSHPMSGSDYQFKALLQQYFPVFQRSNLTEAMAESLEELEDDITELYDENYAHLLTGSRLGGFPKFVQEDERDYLQDEEDYSYLLLQIDSDHDNDIVWGDMGVGQFFIQPSALKRLDFSKVLYTYACS